LTINLLKTQNLIPLLEDNLYCNLLILIWNVFYCVLFMHWNGAKASNWALIEHWYVLGSVRDPITYCLGLMVIWDVSLIIYFTFMMGFLFIKSRHLVQCKSPILVKVTLFSSQKSMACYFLQSPKSRIKTWNLCIHQVATNFMHHSSQSLQWVVNVFLLGNTVRRSLFLTIAYQAYSQGFCHSDPINRMCHSFFTLNFIISFCMLIILNK
jgi:hypothetical protein